MNKFKISLKIQASKFGISILEDYDIKSLYSLLKKMDGGFL
ncbi:hypothetical protein G159_06315 [Planococcus glaciei CHR43]|nr:hypothetical protein G159_06315 [Planococcus glaciei CHR43]